MSLKIGDYNHNGMLRIVDTHWDSNGTLRVTVQEQIGERWDLSTRYGKNALRRARAFARKALPEYYPGQTKGSPLVRTFFADGCTHATFNITRNERY